MFFCVVKIFMKFIYINFLWENVKIENKKINSDMEVKCIFYCVDFVNIVKLIGLWVNLMGKILFDLFDGWRGVCFI